MKKNGVIVTLVAFLLAFCLCFLASCGENKQNEEEEKKEETDKPGEDTHEHDWIRGVTTSGNCQTKGYTTFSCSICGQTRTEETDYGGHDYVNHVCRYDGVRESGIRSYTVAGISFYLYQATRTVSGDITYLLVATGRGVMSDFEVDGETDSRPWAKDYLSAISLIEIDEGVTTIGKNFAKNCTRLRSVTISSTVTKIGESAFEGCSPVEGSTEETLTAIAAPDGIVTVEKNAFKDCKRLRRVTLGKYATDIKEGAFSGCDLLQTLSFGGQSTGKTGAEAYFGNIFGQYEFVTNSAEEIEQATATAKQIVTDKNGKTWYFTLPMAINTVEITGSGTIPTSYFENLKSVRTVIISGEITAIEERAFYQMPDLRFVDFRSDTLLTIANDAFNGASSLGLPAVDRDSPEASAVDDPSMFEPQTIKLPSSLRSIGERAFCGCPKLIQIVFLGDELEKVSNEAFSGCSVLQKLTLPKAVKTIGRRAFYGSGITEIRLGENVETIMPGAFESCGKLNVVYIDCKNAYCTQNDDAKLFSNAREIYVRKDVLGKTTAEQKAEAKAEDSKFIKKNFKYKGLDMENDSYYLWEK